MNYKAYEENVLVTGDGGTGKSWLDTHYLIPALEGSYASFYFWDIPRSYGSESLRTPIVSSVRELTSVSSAIVQPWDQSEEEFDAFCKFIWHKSNCVMILEEAHLYQTKQSIRSKFYKKIVTSGRPKGITTITVTRRPQLLNNTVLATSDHIFMFSHQLPGDIELFKKWIGPLAEARLNRLKHEFVYKNMRSGEEGIFRLAWDGRHWMLMRRKSA